MPARRVQIAEVLPQALEFYLDVHEHPELSGDERRTAQAFADALAAQGYAITTGIGGHGVVGVLRHGDGPAVMIRAELDALPLTEATGLRYASTVTAMTPEGTREGVMHACGHDAHLASALGAAAVLTRHRGLWSGSVVVVGQPAEETLVGAAAMLDEGLYDRFGVPDVVLAQHLAPFPAGCVAHAQGGRAALGAGASLRVTVTGSGGHVADLSSRTTNPVDAAARLVTALPGAMPSGATLTVTQIQAGVAHNIVPNHAVITVSIRSTTMSGLDEALAIATAMCVHAGAAKVAKVAAAEPTVCDADHAVAVRRAHCATIGSDAVLPFRTSMAVDDFSAFSRGGQVPIVYWMLGCVGRQQWAEAARRSPDDILAAIPANHSSRFAPAAGPTVRTGIVAMTSASLACLRGPPVSQL